VYAIIYFDEIKAAVRRHPILVASGAVVLSVAAYQFTPVILDLLEAQFGMKGVSFIGRELIDEMVADSNVNTLLVAIQEMPFLVRLFLNAAYIFLYPFLSIRQVIEADYFDLRNIAMSLVVPIYAFWLNAWFIGGAITSIRVIERQRAVIFALVATMLLIGSYSLQTRHKTVIYALYYIVVAIGFTSSTRFARNFGYAASGFLLLVEIAAALR
jgi:hypothetical protein